jgi:cytochrome P450 family 628
MNQSLIFTFIRFFSLRSQSNAVYWVSPQPFSAPELSPQTRLGRSFHEKNDAMLAAQNHLGSTRKDVFQHFKDSESIFHNQAQLDSNAMFVIGAGSDTTPSTLTQTFRMLCQHRRVLRRLQVEVGGVWEREGNFGVEVTKGMEYLGAVINEVLRLWSPAPSGVQATTLPSGVEINGTYIQSNVQVWVPHAALMRDERYFARATEFVPERWLEEGKHLGKDKRAFIPFGYRVHSCVGKQLVLNEMRAVVASVVREFDLEFGDGYSEERFLDEWKDHVIVKIWKMEMKFLKRK